MEKKKLFDFSTWSMFQLSASHIDTNQRLNVHNNWKYNPLNEAKVYHQPAGETSDAPTAPAECDLPITHNRYFKTPYINNGNQGWWYSHFNGQSLVREIAFELNKSPVLRIAGIHEMCKTSLEEMGLLAKGVEIKDVEFDFMWKGNGGDYIVPIMSQKSYVPTAVKEAKRLKQEEDDYYLAKQLQEQMDIDNESHMFFREKDIGMDQRLKEAERLHQKHLQEQMDKANERDKLNQERLEKMRILLASRNNQMYDPSKRKYSELRDMINTTCDIKLSEACLYEIRRRFKIYNDWKDRNKEKIIMREWELTLKSIMEAAEVPRVQQKSEIPTVKHRYFKIPFVRANEKDISNEKQEWWYAHFDGPFVARQVELHPDKPPVLLTAGVDDMQMCELSLEETGLTEKRGAEILDIEFERVWKRNGGAVYRRPFDRYK